ncbi:carcinoembryonic antigen-related cell adhesion molecule 1-like isoform X2 [Heptranchias perlo]|uniref:carcinoembryonic antigen-related cell adhesion molecule 1-like isoform X2 n=1 Tax=Heptranchias perlo TaxID=212740 RepID=UPI003559E6CA
MWSLARSQTQKWACWSRVAVALENSIIFNFQPTCNWGLKLPSGSHLAVLPSIIEQAEDIIWTHMKSGYLVRDWRVVVSMELYPNRSRHPKTRAGKWIGLDLQQPHTLVATKGDCITLNCSYSIPALTRFTAWWHFHNDDPSSPKIIANLSTNKPRVACSRYSAMHNSSQKAFTLWIADVQASDTGVYHCEVFQTAPPPNVKAKGNGTQLSVIARPSLSLLASSEKTASSPSVTVTCTAYGFYPNIITMRTQATCLTIQLTSQLTSQINSSNPDGTYNHTAIVSISTENCTDSAEFTCTVQHPASQSEMNRTVLIAVHTGDRDGRLWMAHILLSVCGGTACIIPLALFLIKCTRGKGTQERKGTRAGNRRLHLGPDNMDESNGNDICYAELQLGNLQKVRKKEEEVVYSAVLR